jgi:cell wall-associated NlpC family hydrolase
MVDIALLKLLFDKTRGRVKYRLGAKISPLAQSSELMRIDCSGFVRWILARATEQVLLLPDGSQNQLAWCRANLRKLAKYSDVGRQDVRRDESRLFIAFLSPKPGNDWPRHVALLRSNGRNMVTMESCSSLGVGSRPWNHPVFNGVKECFEVK